MVLKLYASLGSQPSRAVRTLLTAAEVPHEFVLINTRAGEHKGPEYMKLNPDGLVPCIDDDGFVLAESGAILTYICETRGLVDWLPTDPRVKAKVEFWLHWNHTNTRNITLKVVRPLLLGAPPISDAVIDAAKAAASACLSYLERFFTSIAPEQSFLVAGDKPTVADLQLVAELDQVLPEAHDLVDFTPYPAVLAWIARVRSAVPAHATVFQPVLDAAAARKAAAAAAAK